MQSAREAVLHEIVRLAREGRRGGPWMLADDVLLMLHALSPRGTSRGLRLVDVGSTAQAVIARESRAVLFVVRVPRSAEYNVVTLSCAEADAKDATLVFPKMQRKWLPKQDCSCNCSEFAARAEFEYLCKHCVVAVLLATTTNLNTELVSDKEFRRLLKKNAVEAKDEDAGGMDETRVG